MNVPIDSGGLYLVLTNPVAGYDACATAAVATRVSRLQLRMKQCAREEVVAVAHRLRAITRGSATSFIVNDDVEIAQEVDADGLHVGQEDMTLSEARWRWPVPGKIFGLSTHSLEQALAAEQLKPDYIGVGPVFATPTKEIADPVLGVQEMERIMAAVKLPTVAIGGINKTNLAEIKAHGATAFAVVRAVNDARDPRAAIRALQRLWDGD